MNSSNHDFKAAPAWSISSEQMELEPGALPGFKCCRAAVNFSVKNCQRYLLRLVLWPSIFFKVRHFLKDKSR